MAIIGLETTLVAIREDDKKLSFSVDDFLACLDVDDDDEQIISSIHIERLSWQSIDIVFYNANQGDFAEYEDSNNAWAEALNNGLLQMSRWIERREQPLREISKSLSLYMLIGLCIDENRASVRMPPKFLSACGNANITVEIFSVPLPH